MNSFLRFLGASRLTESAVDKPLQPYQRFRVLRTTWHSIQRNSTIVDKVIRQDKLLPDIQKITELLIDECTRPDRIAPRVCVEYTLQKGIFPWLVTLACGGPTGLTRKIISVFVDVIETQDENFLSQEVVCRSLNTLLRSLTQRMHKETMTDQIVQLLFSICSKVHQHSPLLAMFFDDVAYLDRTGQVSSSLAHSSTMIDTVVPVRFEDEFLVFYLLIDNMHQPEELGDFCRMGLLYILETANENLTLQKWIAESELPIFLTVGLGSHYSALGSKLHIEQSIDHDLMLASSCKPHPEFMKLNKHHLEVKASSDPDFMSSFEQYLTYLAYWQDILEICQQDELRSTLLDSFRILFLKNILYPSLIESSDVDGGSAVAVSVYLASTLEIMRDADLARITLDYLFASEKQVGPPSRASKRATLISGDTVSSTLTPEFYSLKDMISSNLNSESDDTRLATLRLLDSLIRNHAAFVFHFLFKGSPDNASRTPTIGHHRKEMVTLASLIEDAERESPSSQRYEFYLQDALVGLTSSMTEANAITFASLHSETGESPVKSSIEPSFVVKSDDPLLHEILNMFSSFFANEVDYNLALTKVLLDMASAKIIGLAGWLLPHEAIGPDPSTSRSTRAISEDEMIPVLPETMLNDDYDDNKSLDFVTDTTAKAAESRARPAGSSCPPVLVVVKTLAMQIQKYKSEIESLNQDIQERRRIFDSMDLKVDAATLILEARASAPRDTVQGGAQVMPSTTSESMSPFFKHFSSTKRYVSVLPSASFRDKGIEGSLVDGTPIEQSPVCGSDFSKADLPELVNDMPLEDAPETMTEAVVDLSKLINNIIIFEEFIKEIMAVIQVRHLMSGNCEVV